jgi:hypothetical protein
MILPNNPMRFTMTTSLENVAVLPRALNASELDVVAGGGRSGASFGAMVGFVLGEGVAIAASFLTLNPLPVIVYQTVTAAGGIIVGAALSDD